MSFFCMPSNGIDQVDNLQRETKCELVSPHMSLTFINYVHPINRQSCCPITSLCHHLYFPLHVIDLVDEICLRPFVFSASPYNRPG